METLDKLTVRVYGLLIRDGKMMFLKEMYGYKELVKLPGGGLELGEGTRETLERELREELNLTVQVKEHIYTQDFFLKSTLTPSTQLIAIYYRLECKDISTLEIEEKGIKEIVWIPLDELKVEEIQLPVDRVVITEYLEKMKQQHA